MDVENLKILGLTDNEITVYLAILESGKCSGTQIRKQTGITNSRVYAAIDTLIAKGVITYEKQPKGKVYSALDPGLLKGLMEEKQKKILECIPFLKRLQQKEKAKTETAVFEGLQGFKTALSNLVEECPVGETLLIIGFSNQAYKNEKLAALLRDINKISIKKKHNFKMILDDKSNKFYKRRKEEKISEIRFMGKNFQSPAAIDIFQDKVYILLWDENPYAFTIKNKNIAEGFKTYFYFLWDMAKE